MNKFKFLYLLLVMIFCSEFAFSQTTERICELSSAPGTYYLKGPGDAAGQFSVFLNRVIGPCPYTRNGRNGTTYGACTVRGAPGIQYTVNNVYLCPPPVNVPLDNYAWFLILATGVFGFLTLRKRQVLING